MKMILRKNLLFAAIVILSCLAILEGAARLFETGLRQSRPSIDRSGWQVEFFGSLFDWHEPDPELLWRFKAGLDNPLIRTNSDHLLGDEISRTRSAGTYRILLLGDSSPVGLGLTSRRQTFAESLRYLLDGQFASRKTVDVINAAVSGYSSEQARRFLEKKGWRYDPDVVIVYCGNNDASISGIHTDRELLTGQRLPGMRSLLSHSSLYRILRDQLARSRSKGHLDNAELTVRVSPAEFGQNLNAIYEQCRQKQRPLVIMKPAVPYLWPAGLQFKPFAHVKNADGHLILPDALLRYLDRRLTYCLKRDSVGGSSGPRDIFTREVYHSAFVDSMPAIDAIRLYRSRVTADSADLVSWNNLGVAYWRTGKYTAADECLKHARQIFCRGNVQPMPPAQIAAGSPMLYNIGINLLSADSIFDPASYDTTGLAFEYLDSALQCDYFSLRIKSPYWREIDKLIGLPGIAVIDLPTIFQNNGGDRLFIDHCHPRAEGHLLIATSIFDTLRSRGW